MADEGDLLNVPFIDILFGLAIGQIFVEVSSAGLDQISIAGWAHFALAAAVIVLSWVGYHASRREFTWKPTFYDKAFAQFFVDILIVALYFVLVLTAEGVPGLGGTRGRAASAVPETVIVAAIFCSYIAWDFFEIRLRKEKVPGSPKVSEAECRRMVTCVFTFIFLVIAILVFVFNPSASGWVVGIDVLLLVVLNAYRLAGVCFCPVATDIFSL